MFGAIIGDINGSIYQDKRLDEKYISLNQSSMYFTDDTILTIALMKVFNSLNKDLMSISLNTLKNKIIKTFKELTRKYPDREYGGRYFEWAMTDTYYDPKSIGNGSAMRVSPCAFVSNSLEEVQYLAKVQASVTHNTKDGIKGA